LSVETMEESMEFTLLELILRVLLQHAIDMLF
jgi:hypothetical protein